MISFTRFGEKEIALLTQLAKELTDMNITVNVNINQSPCVPPPPRRKKTAPGHLSSGDSMSCIQYRYTCSPKSADDVVKARVKVTVDGFEQDPGYDRDWPAGAPAPIVTFYVPEGAKFHVADSDFDAKGNESYDSPAIVVESASDTTAPPAPGGGTLSKGDTVGDELLPVRTPVTP